MNFYRFLKKESDKPLLKLYILTALSGLSSAGVLAIINAAAKKASNGTIGINLLLMFASAVGIFIVSQKYILTYGITIIEEILNTVRLRLSDKIRKTDLFAIEQIGRAEIYNRLTQECGLISQMSPYTITTLQSAIMLVFVFGYIAFLSIFAAILLVLVIIAGVLIFQKNNVKVYAELNETNKAEMYLFDSVTNILDGLKEIKLNRKKSNDVYSQLVKLTFKLKKLKISTGFKFSENMVFSQAFIYIILGTIVFVLPRLNPSIIKETISTTTAMLFAVGPLTSIVSMLPVLGQINLAIKNIYGLEKELDEKVNYNEVQPTDRGKLFTGFKKIALNDIYFEYTNKDSREMFSIGPIDITINRGEVIFVIGGNGCGKTTFLKTLTMLYQAQSGKIYVDDTLIDNTCYLEYRELYSAIFNDFHLFDKLYGLENVDTDKIDNLLKLMKLEKKTEFRDNGFTKRDLSTGQRKRLALIVTFMENKPIFIFDEWAADQDPQFKNYFYDELLNKLRAEGKTVIAVSHDDRYFHLADRIIKMEYGKIV